MARSTSSWALSKSELGHYWACFAKVLNMIAVLGFRKVAFARRVQDSKWKWVIVGLALPKFSTSSLFWDPERLHLGVEYKIAVEVGHCWACFTEVLNIIAVLGSRKVAFGR